MLDYTHYAMAMYAQQGTFYHLVTALSFMNDFLMRESPVGTTLCAHMGGKVISAGFSQGSMNRTEQLKGY